MYFSPEAHAAYQALGYGPSSAEMGGVAMPEMEAYFCSRGSVMGQVPGAVVASAFGVFNHELVERIVDAGWAKTDAITLCAARDEGGIGQLRRILGEAPAGVEEVRDLLAQGNAGLTPYGKPLYAGLSAQCRFDDPLADAWRLADRLREYRGDAHVAAWTNAGLSACEIGLMSELYWGLPARSYSRSRMWSEAQYDAAEARLEGLGLMADHVLTDAGRDFREAIELDTDRACAPIIENLGDGLDDLLAVLVPWGEQIRAGKGYPASGPHELAELAARS